MFHFPKFQKSNSHHQTPAKIYSLKVSQRNSQSKTRQRVADLVYGNYCAGQFRRAMPRAHLATMNEGVSWLKANGPFWA